MKRLILTKYGYLILFMIPLIFCVAGFGQTNPPESPAGPEYSPELIYKNKFESFDDIRDWVLEGPGRIYFWENKMTVIPVAQQALYKKWEKEGRRKLDPKKEYYPAVKKYLTESNPSIVDKLKNKEGKFEGGHIVCWNKAFVTGDSYCIEYDFKPLSPVGLGIIFFSAAGSGGQDVLSGELQPRYGVFTDYVKSDIDCYHISYWANNAAVGKRGTCNLRKNSGFYRLADGEDPTAEDLDYSHPTFNFDTYRIRLMKKGNEIKFYIDDELVIDYTDNHYNDILNSKGEVEKEDVDTGEPLGAGRIGIRQMVGLIGQYDNFKVYNLIENK